MVEVDCPKKLEREKEIALVLRQADPSRLVTGQEPRRRLDLVEEPTYRLELLGRTRYCVSGQSNNRRRFRRGRLWLLRRRRARFDFGEEPVVAGFGLGVAEAAEVPQLRARAAEAYKGLPGGLVTTEFWGPI